MHLAHLPGEKIKDSGPPVWIRDRAQVTLWLMKQNVGALQSWLHNFAIDQHSIDVRVDTCSLLTDRYTIDLYTPRGNHLLSMAARGYPGVSKKAGQALLGGWYHSLFPPH